MIRPGIQHFVLINVVNTLVVFSTAYAIQPAGFPTDVSFEDCLHQSFFSKDGLPSNWINDIIQTGDGFIWIGTDNGLVKYDGRKFRIFNHANTPQLPLNEIRRLFESSDGSLWIGTASGLARYSPGRPGIFEECLTFSDIKIWDVFEDSNNRLWVGTQFDTYCCDDDSQFRVVEYAPQNVRTFSQDNNGILWLGSNDGLFRCSGETVEQITHERLPAKAKSSGGVRSTRVNTILADGNDLWIGTNRTLLHMRDGEFTSLGEDLEAQQVYEIVKAPDGRFLIGARFGVFVCAGSGPLQRVSDVPSARVIMEDKDGGLWIGYGDNRGLHQYRSRFETTIWDESFVRCIHRDKSGTLWFGSSNGLHRVDEEGITDFGINDGLPDSRVKSIADSQRDGCLWIGTGRGVVHWSNSGLLASDRVSRLADMNTTAIFEDSQGSLWCSLSSFGGYRLIEGELQRLHQLDSGSIHWFWEDEDQTIWMGHDTGLYRWKDHELKKVTDPDLAPMKNPRFMCHCVGKDGALWMGTSNGIVHFKSGKFTSIPPDRGLEVDNVERLAIDENDNVWIGGRDGLFFVSLGNLQAFVDDRQTRVSAFRVDGFNRFPPLGSYSQGCLIQGEELWLVAENGLVSIPLDSFQDRETPPTVFVENMTIDGSDVNFQEDFHYQSGRRRLVIDFSSPDFVFPRHLQLKYKLEGRDEEWTDANGIRSAAYTDLRPGDYTFRVAARNSNPQWVETERPVRFSVLPRWWEMIWLRAVALIALIAVGIGLMHFRIRKVNESNALLRKEIHDRIKAEEASRQHLEQLARVSRASTMGELTTSIAHEVKQPLFAIVSNAQTAQRMLNGTQPDIAEVQDALKDIADDGNRASSIIEHIQALVKKEPTARHSLNLNALTRDVAKLAAPELRRRNLELVTEFARDLPSIRGDEIELQQVILNLLINGAQAMNETDGNSRRLVVRTNHGDGDVELSVVDFGTGFDESERQRLFEPFFTTKSSGTGMGLAICRSIIEAHSGQIWAKTNEFGGSTFGFSIPAELSSQS